MEENLLTLICIILLIIGILGTFLPILPSLLVSYAGLLIYRFGTNSHMSLWYLLIFGILILISIALKYFISIDVKKRYGNSNTASLTAFIGTLLGVFFISTIFGFLVGMLLGAYLGELYYNRDEYRKALHSTKEIFIGYLYSSGFSFALAAAILITVLKDLI
ncbi:DUF456 family protein [Elizabethkingia argentiflava]|uniref:DUF456 family protein n=2 Tax=Elizabethkingia argenteiflava TaxID=2681556 RepID=A0A845PT69_9FLAO|nr:DUF456 family protein [Elizabethkingia argenteiflava]